MAAAVRVATFPFRAIGRLIKLLFLPVALGALAWWLATTSGLTWLWWATGLCGLWAFVMVRLWLVQTRGELRSLARGTVHVHAGDRRRFRRDGHR